MRECRSSGGLLRPSSLRDASSRGAQATTRSRILQKGWIASLSLAMTSTRSNLYQRLHLRLACLFLFAEHTCKTGEKRIDRVADHLLLAFEHRRFVDEFANSVIEDAAVEHPGHLELGRARLALCR